ncbi:hypothetical protein A11A3_00060 [Alcanivorax hongdengensis A-11-3]|uniref:AraC family transcriptional regulator n=1 Tax=Alcanivorax hongdengensis A-11-3 TaxID=1177179 RepID=L0WJ20_9GAMM|nr:hypothetical protein [Alcanivorax hongdengensis]EKF75840.1 hypothetical protein A11A3_00060 [Alcanivorax hongdengensis A-11-3]
MRRVVGLLLIMVAAQLHGAELDKDLADFKRDVLEVNKRLLLLEEELLFPADTQVGLYVSLDVGHYFAPDSLTLKMDGKVLASHLYTDKELRALKNGAIQRLALANVKNGFHDVTAFVTGIGPQGREFRLGVEGRFEKKHGRHFVQLHIEDDAAKQQPRLYFRDWQ